MHSSISRLMFFANVAGVLLLLLSGPRLAHTFSRLFDGEDGDAVALRRELERRHDLDQLRLASVRRREAQRQTAQEVIAGRLSLADALARYRELSRARPAFAPTAGDRKADYRRLTLFIEEIEHETRLRQRSVTGERLRANRQRGRMAE